MQQEQVLPIPATELFEPGTVPQLKWGDLIARDPAGSFRQAGDIVPSGGVQTGSGGSGGEQELRGIVTTEDATPKLVHVTSMAPGMTVILVSKVSAKGSDGNHGGFVRTATYKNVSGTISLIDQIQDDHTMRNDSAWDVDYASDSAGVYIKVFGKSSVTITWSYSILFRVI